MFGLRVFIVNIVKNAYHQPLKTILTTVIMIP